MSPAADSRELLSSNPTDVRAWLKSNNPAKLVATLDKFEIELRLGRLTQMSDPELEQDEAIDTLMTQHTSNRRLVTRRTVELFKVILGSARWRTAAQLMLLIKGLGRELHAAGGHREPAIGNVVRRIMSCVREEVARHAAQEQAEEESQIGNVVKRLSDKLDLSSTSLNESSSNLISPRDTASTPGSSATKIQRNLSLASMLWAHPQHVTVKRTGSGLKSSSGTNPTGRLRSDSFSNDPSTPIKATMLDSFPDSFHVVRSDLRVTIMEAIQEIANDLEDLYKNITDQATSHIHADEIILTYGRSKTIELFLKAAAAKKRKFQVIICEGAPHFGGHAMALSLAKVGIETVVINDSAACAILARVNKVLLPAHAVLANGGLIGPSGSHVVALAARQHSVPVVCITGMFKLCPQFPHEGQDTLNDLVSVSSVMSYVEMTSQFDLLGCDHVEYINPIHDYIPPKCINLYVTNIGGFQPSYIYRLLAEYYHTDDWESFE